MQLEPGLEGNATLTVGEEDTAIALGSGDVPVLGTPRVIALCEAATVRAVEGRLEVGGTTVGTRVELDHLQASDIGAQVRAVARLVEVDGRRLTFSVEARDGHQVVARGVVTRVVVDRARFGATSA